MGTIILVIVLVIVFIVVVSLCWCMFGGTNTKGAGNLWLFLLGPVGWIAWMIVRDRKSHTKGQPKEVSNRVARPATRRNESWEKSGQKGKETSERYGQERLVQPRKATTANSEA